MRRINQKPQDKKIFTCPQCRKQRMTRPIDHKVDVAKQEYQTKDKTTIELFVDICDSCKVRNNRLHFEPSKADIRRVLKSMQENVELSGDQSLEELL